MKYGLLAAVLTLLLGPILVACGGEDATPTRRLAGVARQAPAPSAALVPAATLVPVLAEPVASGGLSTAVLPAPALTLPETAFPKSPAATVPAPVAAGVPRRLVPISVTESGSLRAALSSGELACVEARGLGGTLEEPFLALGKEQAVVMGCLEEETVLRVFLGGLTGGLEELESDTSSCVRRGTELLDLHSVMTSALRGEEDRTLGSSMAGLLVVAACLSEEEFAVAAPALGMGSGDRDAQWCIVEALGGIEELAVALAGGEGGMVALMGAVAFCGLSPGSLNP